MSHDATCVLIAANEGVLGRVRVNVIEILYDMRVSVKQGYAFQ